MVSVTTGQSRRPLAIANGTPTLRRRPRTRDINRAYVGAGRASGRVWITAMPGLRRVRLQEIGVGRTPE